MLRLASIHSHGFVLTDDSPVGPLGLTTKSLWVPFRAVAVIKVMASGERLSVVLNDGAAAYEVGIEDEDEAARARVGMLRDRFLTSG